MKHKNLEEALIEMCQSDDFDLAKAGFIASGVRDEKELEDYMKRFEGLCSRISAGTIFSLCPPSLIKAKVVFDWFWNSKPTRYNSDSRLTEALDNQLSEKEEVGDCMGLTLLYNSVCQRLGIPMKAVYTVGHIYSALDEGSGLFPIENTKRDGFFVGCGRGIVIGNQQLIQRLLISLASDYEKTNDYRKAFDLYELAFKINPEERIRELHTLQGLSEKLGDLDLAVNAYEDILERHPKSHNAHEGLADALAKRNKKNDALEAIKHYEQALTDSDDDYYIHWRLGGLYTKVGKYKRAYDSFQKAVDIKPDDKSYHHLLVISKLRLAVHKAVDFLNPFNQLKKIFDPSFSFKKEYLKRENET